MQPGAATQRGMKAQ